MESLRLLSTSKENLSDDEEHLSDLGAIDDTSQSIPKSQNLFTRILSRTLRPRKPRGRSEHRRRSSRGSSKPHRSRCWHKFRCRGVFWKHVKRLTWLIFALFLAFSTFNAISSNSYANPPKRYYDLEESVQSSTKSGRANINNEKVFVAANIVNEKLIRGAWGENLVSLIDLLGEDNVFVSIYENDSGNGTSDALRQLQQRLKCKSSVVSGEHVPLSEFPTIRLPNGEERVQRLTYLAEMRDRLLRPLDPAYQKSTTRGFQSAIDVKFDRILFLNDVYYSPLEAAQLLFSTNAGSGRAQYRTACALDFVLLFKLYDTFVLRDSDGYPLALQFYPWFTQRGSGTSRKGALEMSDAIDVRSCWGGMAAFNASTFQPQKPAGVNSPGDDQQLLLKFRSDGEPFWEAAECCLIFADMETKFGTPSHTGGSGVFVNPYVRTAYSPMTWRWTPFFKRYEHFFEYFQHFVDTVKHPERNPRRTHEAGKMVDELVWLSSDQASTFQNGGFVVQHRAAPPGGYCGQRRMFVMKKDVEAANKAGRGKNWEKVPVPSHTELYDS